MYIYYGMSSGSFSFGSASLSGSACVVGVPNSVSLTGAGNLGLPSINLVLGGVTQPLLAYAPNGSKRTIGIVLPDSSMVYAHAETSPAVNTGSGHTNILVYLLSGGYVNTPYVDSNGVPCTSIPGAFYGCANYLLGY